MSLSLVRRAFEVPLATFAQAQGLALAFDNVAFTPPTGMHLRAFLIPAGTGSDDLAGKHRRYEGTFQVSVMAPAGQGAGPGQAVADQVAALFPLDVPLIVDGQRVVLLSPMSQGPHQPEADWFGIPLSCAYRLDTI